MPVAIRTSVTWSFEQCSKRHVIRPMASVAYDASLFDAFVQTRPRIVLGSNSTSRRAVLDELVKEHGLTYEVAPAFIDEKAIRRNDPSDLVVTLGYEKAKALLEKNNENWKQDQTYLITGDQVVVHDGKILEKPESKDEIHQNVRGFSQTPAQTVGSVVCSHIPSKLQMHEVDVASVYMNPIPSNVVEQLIEEGAVFHSAGGLLAEHPLVAPYVTRIEGGLDAVMGLSKNTAAMLLLKMWERVQDSTKHRPADAN